MNRGKVCVFGSFIVDLMMRAPRLPIPGETVKGLIFKMGPGGKGSNQGVAAQRAGAETMMITKVGNDEFAPIALNSFKGEGIGLDSIFRDEFHQTGAALIMVDDQTGQNKIVVTLGACDHITRDNIDQCRPELIQTKIFLTQLETNLDAMEYAISIASRHFIPVILNPAPAELISDSILTRVDYITPNESEASLLCGFPVVSEDDFRRAGQFFLAKGVKNVIITLGDKGAFLINSRKEQWFPAFKVHAVDTTGAGDAFNGGLAAALAEGMPLEKAIPFANAAGALCATKMGTAPAMPTRQEIEALIESQGSR